MAHVLKNLGLKRALVVHGSDGLDEITTTAPTFISEFNGKEVISYDISPEELDIPLATDKDLTGGDLKTNVKIVEDILLGKHGPKRDIVLLNAAYAIYIAEKTASIPEAFEMARKSIDEGKAAHKLNALREFTHKV
jgi:anthranilate phosphoribosyltransferase